MSPGGKFRNAECAVVVGIDLNGLGVIRALASAGVRVIALDTKLDKPTATTRYGSKLRVQALSGPRFVGDLLALRSRFESNPVLFLTQEASVNTVSAERDTLHDAYRFTFPDHSIMLDLLDKLRFQVLAERHEFPIPRAVRIDPLLKWEAVERLRFPCVLKPTTKHDEYGKRFAKAYKVASADEVARLWSAMRDVVGEIVVQEWIEGTDADVYFCLQYRPWSGPSVSFVGRKICQWPPSVGGTASCMPAPDAEAELTMLTDKFFEAIGFVGLGSMEYKRDVRDGRFYMVEPTVGRSDYQEEIATLNGANIPFAAYCGELGLPAPPRAKVDPPRAWRDPVGYAKARIAGAPDPIRQLSPSIRICDAYFRFHDPMPYIASKLQAIRNRVLGTEKASV